MINRTAPPVTVGAGILLSISEQLRGSDENSFISNGRYVYGKATAYGFTPMEFDNLTSLKEQALFSAISPYIFKGGQRNKSNVEGIGNCLIFDIDAYEDMSVDLFAKVASMGIQYAIIPTQNHLVLIDGKVAHKFRLLIPIDGITDVGQYVNAIHWVEKTYKLPNVDRATYDVGRFYAPTVPKLGQSFNNNGEMMAVTEDIVAGILQRIGAEFTDTGFELPTDRYPSDSASPRLVYKEEFQQSSPTLDTPIGINEIRGDTMSEVFETPENTVNNALLQPLLVRGQVPIGAIAGIMKRGERVGCQCPTSHLHSDQSDERYAWLRKTGGGDTLLFCGSDHCRTEFGDSRKVVLPPFNVFVSETNRDTTINMIETTIAELFNELAFLVKDAMCAIEGVTFSSVYEQIDHTKTRLNDGTLIDVNALRVFITSVLSIDRGSVLVNTLDLSGSLIGSITLTKGVQSITYNWNHLVFKPLWDEVYTKSNNTDLNKGNVLKLIAEKVGADQYMSKVVKEGYHIKHSSPTSRKPMMEVSNLGREQILESNGFDDKLYVHRENLLRQGIASDPMYNDIVSAFVDHWKLPYGSVEFMGNEVKNLPYLIMLLASFNLFSDGKGNQRHTTFVVTAPPEVGKSSLIKNFYECGLSNSDKFQADVFGYDGLYPTSVDELKSCLFHTGDELSPTLMKGISMPMLLGNLTRKEIDINVKRKIDSTFYSFCKVLWGARAWDAVSNIPQATELRSRLFAVTYRDEHFDKSRFKAICATDTGIVDKAVQLYLCEMYIEIKATLKPLDEKTRIKAFNSLKQAIKDKYDGTTEYSYAEETEEYVPTKVLTDKDRVNKKLLEAMLNWKAGVLQNPIAEEQGSARSSMIYDRLKTEESMMAVRGLDKYFLANELYNYKDPDHLYIIVPTKGRARPYWDDFIKVILTRYGGMSRRELEYISMEKDHFLRYLKSIGFAGVDTQTVRHIDSIKGVNIQKMPMYKISKGILNEND